MTTQAIMPTYGRLNEFIKGEGCWLSTRMASDTSTPSGLGVVALRHAPRNCWANTTQGGVTAYIEPLSHSESKGWLIAWPRYRVWRTCSSAIRALKRANALLKSRVCTGTKKDCRARDYRRR